MLLRLIALFTIIPLFELTLLIQLGQSIGLGSTLFIVIFTGIWGAYLARQQGFYVISRIQNDIANSRIPTDSLLDGVLILAGGLLLITPGLLTDAVGFSVLIPSLRKYIKKYLIQKFKHKFQSRRVYTDYTNEPQ